jgi:hypothetical protein
MFTPEQVVVYLTIFAAIMGGLIWVIKAVSAIQKQTERNGGSSMRDQIDRIERRQIEIASDVKEARAEFHSHIQWHLDQEAK